MHLLVVSHALERFEVLRHTESGHTSAVLVANFNQTLRQLCPILCKTQHKTHKARAEINVPSALCTH
jgi:hypothetical protein